MSEAEVNDLDTECMRGVLIGATSKRTKGTILLYNI